jgi:hypothetical protein
MHNSMKIKKYGRLLQSFRYLFAISWSNPVILTLMKRSLLILLLFTLCYHGIKAQDAGIKSVYLITVNPGTETYSIYGHSALRVADAETGSDSFYNWGVFDFETPHFAWKFAKGRLDYMLDINTPNSFLGEYIYEKRSVFQQKINLTPEETKKLLALIDENLKPENAKYRYDFFYDDCSTRIRDIIEKAVGTKLNYPPDEKIYKTTFREEVGKYQQPYPWLKFGCDLIMGRPGEKTTNLRDRMFLPLGLMDGLSRAYLNRDGKMVPLLSNPIPVLQFDAPAIKPGIFSTPVFLFSLLLILLIIQVALYKGRKLNLIIDLILFTAFSCLSVLMIFFNFFTDHAQMKWNLNIIWLSPFIFVCLAALILNKPWEKWFRTVFFLCVLAFVIQILMPNGYNGAFIPLILILMLRSASRARFSWNPLSLNTI